MKRAAQRWHLLEQLATAEQIHCITLHQLSSLCPNSYSKLFLNQCDSPQQAVEISGNPTHCKVQKGLIDYYKSKL